MKKSVLIFMLLALGLTGGTIFFVNKWLKKEREKAVETVKKQPDRPAESGVFVLIAAKPLSAGRFVTAQDLRWQSWPDRAVPREYIVRPQGSSDAVPAQFVGTVTRQATPAGQPLTQDMVVKPGDAGFLAAVLRVNMRAISVRVDETTGVSGLVFPGDRIDLILIHEANAGDGPATGGRQQRFGETILTGVRVLAIDQQLEDLKGKGAPKQARTVTVEVSQKQAEIVAVATRMGTLTLSLHSLACPEPNAQSATLGDAPNCTPGKSDDKAERGRTFTADTEVSRAMSETKKAGPSTEITVIRGSQLNVQSSDGKLVSSSGASGTPGNVVRPGSIMPQPPGTTVTSPAPAR